MDHYGEINENCKCRVQLHSKTQQEQVRTKELPPCKKAIGFLQPKRHIVSEIIVHQRRAGQWPGQVWH